MRTAESTIYKHTRGQTFYLSIPSKMVSDSTFPFKQGEQVELIIVGQKLEVRKK